MFGAMDGYDNHLREKAESWREFAKLAGSADERARRERLARYFAELADKHNSTVGETAPPPVSE